MILEGYYVRQHHNVAKQFLPSGGLHVLAGRNGAGKTSVLSAIALLGDHPHPFAGLSELGLGPNQSDSSQAFRIYELDDDLSGDFIDVDDRGNRSLRSTAVLELVLSSLGPAALHKIVTVSDGSHGPPEALLDMERLKMEWDRAVGLFRHCGAVSYLAEEGPESVVSGLSKFARSAYEAELSWLVDSFQLDGWRLRFREAADQLLAHLVQVKKIAWSGNYSGLVIDRSDVSVELGEFLTEIANGYGDHNEFLDQDGFLSFGEERFVREPNSYDLGKELVASMPGYDMGTVPPVVVVARQWVGHEPLLILSLSPDVGGGTPLSGSVDYVGPVKSPYNEEKMWRYSSSPAATGLEEERDALPAFQRLSDRYTVHPLVGGVNPFGGGPPHGPDPLAAVVASGNATGLAEELEMALPRLFNHVWSFVSGVALRGSTGNSEHGGRSIIQFLPSEQQFLFTTDRRTKIGPLRMGGSSKADFGQRKLTVDPWMGSVGDRHDGGALGRPYFSRPGLQTVCSLLAFKANEIAPLFVRSAGLIRIDARTVPVVEGETPRVVVEYDGKPLDELPAGTARWVAITVRIAGRLLLQSKVLLREAWGSDEVEMQRYLGDLNLEQVTALEERPEGVTRYGILRHAVEVLEREDGHLDLEVLPDYRSEGETVLLVDEPELHLHQDALLDVRKWLRDRTTEGEITAVVATHSPVFMDYLPEEASVHGLLTAPDGGTVLTDMTSGLGTWIEGDAEALGVASLDGLFGYRGFLLVEGKHDEIVLRRFYGDELERKRIGVVAMWGTRGKFDLTEARYLQLVRRPVAMLLDNIPEGGSGASDMTAEQRELSEFIESFEREGIQFCGEGHHLQDIIYALPEAAVQRLCEERTGTSLPEWRWGEIGEVIRTEFRFKKSREKKLEAERRLGLRSTRHGLSVRNFIDPVLDHCTADDRPHESLEKAMKRIWGFFEAHDRYA